MALVMMTLLGRNDRWKKKFWGWHNMARRKAHPGAGPPLAALARWVPMKRPRIITAFLVITAAWIGLFWAFGAFEAAPEWFDSLKELVGRSRSLYLTSPAYALSLYTLALLVT